MVKKQKIDSSEIINLYEEGYSAKDICGIFDLSALTVRNILREAGFLTHTYRKIEKLNKDKILLLVQAGYSYKQIEKLLHCSFHLIREVVEAAGLVGFSPKNRPPVQLTVNENEVSFDILKRLDELYYLGKCGLAKCAEEVGASDKEFLWFVFHLNPADQTKHGNHLKINIIKMHSDGTPVTAIAKKMSISLSIVKKLLLKSYVS